MDFFILGGTGFVGKHLTSYLLSKGHGVTLLVRSESKRESLPDKARTVKGDPMQEGKWQKEAAAAEALVNLVGRNIFTRWTEQEKEAIYSSRIQATRMAVQSLGLSSGPPPCLINANAVGYYPATSEEIFDESDPPGSNFLARVSVDWQKEALEGENLGARVVVTRFAPVLERDGGVLANMLTPFRFGLGGRLGSGKQPFPWVHMLDLVRAIEFCAINEAVRGPVNVCAPEIISNEDFSRALAEALHRPALVPVPEFAVKLVFGELAQMVLQGPKVLPKALLDHGFDFHFPKIREALQDIVAKKKQG
jgi:hypothetical protein